MKKALFLLLILSAFAGIVCADNTDVSQEYLVNRTFRNDGLYDFRKTVTDPLVPVVLSTTQRYGTCTICAETDNTGVMTIGGTTTVGFPIASRRGVPLSPGACYTLQTSGDLAKIYVGTVVTGDGVTVVYTN